VNQHHAIFVEGQYSFPTTSFSPRIIDGGANIGLACIYWKQRWPQAQVTAFEADPSIASVLRANLSAAGIVDVEVVESALSDKEGTLRFQRDGGDAGRLSEGGDLEVSAVRLRPYLRQPVDLLKLDIEGAETDVLLDCADMLDNVARIFVEYHSLVGTPQQLGELHDLLASSGFRLHVKTEYCSPQPFWKVIDLLGMDSQLNVWAVRP